MGNPTAHIAEGITDAAGAGKRAGDKGKAGAMRAVGKGKDAAAGPAEHVKATTDRAAEQSKDACEAPDAGKDRSNA